MTQSQNRSMRIPAIAGAIAAVAIALTGTGLAIADGAKQQQALIAGAATHLDDCVPVSAKTKKGDQVQWNSCSTVVQVHLSGKPDQFILFSSTMYRGTILAEGIPITSVMKSGHYKMARVPLDCWQQQSKDGQACRFITRSDSDYLEMYKRTSS